MAMSRLQRLYEEFGQSPWLDNLRREALESGEIRRWVADGVRGITSNPAIFAKSMKGVEYEAQLRRLAAEGRSVEDCYWQLVISDISAAMEQLRSVYDRSEGTDGFVSVEVSPMLAEDTDGTIAAARWLRQHIDGPNLLIKVPATPAGLPAITRLIAEGISVNVTLIFTLDRYEEVIDAYLAGLEQHTGDLSSIASVASFFISRVDSAIDPLLSDAGEAAASLVGTAAVTQAQLAFDLAATKFSGVRWEALAGRGAQPQRPLWASTSTKNPSYPDTLYVDRLIGPGTVNTLPDPTLIAFADHGALERTIDLDIDAARQRWNAIGEVVDLSAVGGRLEAEGVGLFCDSFESLLVDLSGRIEAMGSASNE